MCGLQNDYNRHASCETDADNTDLPHRASGNFPIERVRRVKVSVISRSVPTHIGDLQRMAMEVDQKTNARILGLLYQVCRHRQYPGEKKRDFRCMRNMAHKNKAR